MIPAIPILVDAFVVVSATYAGWKISKLINVLMSKGGKQNIRDSGLINVSDEEVSRRARDKTLPSKERQRYIKEEKERGNRNKNKRKNNC